MAAEPFSSIEAVDLGPLVERIGDARVVLLGEMTHGTSEFYRLRARITQELVAHHGFDVVALEADWPDAARVDHYIRHREVAPREWQPFARWPPWMWRNEEFADLVEALRGHNQERVPARRAMVCGLDLYSMSTSITEVLAYLEEHDPEAARAARQRYGCLSGWAEDPAHYGAAALRGLADCEEPVLEMLQQMLRRREPELDGNDLFEAQRNAALVKAAEEYYRAMYRGEVSSWNLRDAHMMEVLEAVLAHRGDASRAVVWAHNSHVGDAAASQMGRRGETTLGALCRQRFGQQAYLVGQFTDRGTVIAGDDWDAPPRVKEVQPARRDSHEAWLGRHGRRFLMPLRGVEEAGGKLERAIGVVYRPDSERASHYFHSDLAGRFDEVAWFETTQAVKPLDVPIQHDVPETYPFGV